MSSTERSATEMVKAEHALTPRHPAAVARCQLSRDQCSGEVDVCNSRVTQLDELIFNISWTESPLVNHLDLRLSVSSVNRNPHRIVLMFGAVDTSG